VTTLVEDHAMTNDPAPGGEQPGWQGQPPYPGAYGQQPNDQPGSGYGQYGQPGSGYGYGQPAEQPAGAYGASYPPPGQQAGYGQAPPPWSVPGGQQAGDPGRQSWPGGHPGPAGLGHGGVGPQGEAQGFSAALFDFGFNSFATPVVIKVLYILSLVGVGLVYVIAVISGFIQDPVTGLITLVVGGVMALISLIYTRVILELLFAVVRIAEDVRVMRNRP
jgi:Domain of unknown function (DUF4282)